MTACTFHAGQRHSAPTAPRSSTRDCSADVHTDAVLHRYNTASRSWTQTGSLAVARAGAGLVTLQVRPPCSSDPSIP